MSNRVSQVIYDDKFFDALEKGVLESARVIVPHVVKLVKPRSVVDVGCGRGAWLRVFQENGVTVLRGLDGEYVDTSKFLVDPALFTPADLDRPFVVGGVYDLAVCLEVAEHLSDRSAHRLVRTLTGAAPVVLWSAAIPGQGGTDHLNEQWPWYWQALFAEHGYRKLDPFRRKLWHDRRIESYYRQNILLYASDSAISRCAWLLRESEIASACDLEVVHKDVLMRYSYGRGLLAELARIAWINIRRRVGACSSPDGTG